MKRLIDTARARPATTAALILAGVSVVAVTAFLIGGSTRPLVGAADGPTLDIAVVAPVEPDIQPGETMGVGDLVDGFDRAALATATPAPIENETWAEPAYVEEHGWDDRSPPPYSRGEPVIVRGGDTVRVYGRESYDVPPMERPRPMIGGRGDRLGLGFDMRRPDFVAERHARLEAEAVRQLREERLRARTGRADAERADTGRAGADLDAEAAFY